LSFFAITANYKIYVTGYFTEETKQVLGVTIWKKKEIKTKLIKIVTSNFANIILPYANTLYIIKLEAYENGNLIGISNNLKVMPSYRSSGVKEGISRIFISSTKAQLIEGWYDDQIELAFRYVITIPDGKDGLITEVEKGSDHYLNGSWKLRPFFGGIVWIPDDTERDVNLNLFQWFRHMKSITDGNEINYYNNGAYSVFVRELDVKSLGNFFGDASIDVNKSVVRLTKVLTTTGTVDLSEEIISLGKYAVKYMLDDDPLITYQIDWWTGNYEKFENDGFIVYTKYTNP